MTRKLQFAEEGPTLHVESYELLKTLRWCERLIKSIKNKIYSNMFHLSAVVVEKLKKKKHLAIVIHAYQIIMLAHAFIKVFKQLKLTM